MKKVPSSGVPGTETLRARLDVTNRQQKINDGATLKSFFNNLLSTPSFDDLYSTQQAVANSFIDFLKTAPSAEQKDTVTAWIMDNARNPTDLMDRIDTKLGYPGVKAEIAEAQQNVTK